MKRVLCVDDEVDVVRGFQRNLRRDFTIEIAQEAAKALDVLRQGEPFAVIVADMYMPGMTGIELLAKAREIAPNTARIMLTGHAEMSLAIRAMHEGSVFRFLTKPCSVDDLRSAIHAGIVQHELLTAEKELLEGTLKGAIGVLMDVLSAVAPDSFGRAQAHRAVASSVAQAMKLDGVRDVELGAMLAAIGLVSVPPDVLLKVRDGMQLSPVEEAMVARVPEIGSSILGRIPRLEEAARIVLYQYKRFDGSGFPADSVARVHIPIGARILKVVRDVHALEAAGTPISEAIAMMRGRSGWYDPEVLEATASLLIHRDASNPEGAEAEPVPVKVRDLRTGDVLASDLKTTTGTLLVGKGNRLSETILHRLRNMDRLHGLVDPVLVQLPRP